MHAHRLLLNNTYTVWFYLKVTQCAILFFFQIVLPVIYSFAVPCMLVFFIECIYRKYEEHQMVQIRKKVSSVLIGSWVHWYVFHSIRGDCILFFPNIENIKYDLTA